MFKTGLLLLTHIPKRFVSDDNKINEWLKQKKKYRKKRLKKNFGKLLISCARIWTRQNNFNFAERFVALKAELEKQMAEEDELNECIKNNLEKIIIIEKYDSL